MWVWIVGYVLLAGALVGAFTAYVMRTSGKD